MKKTILGSPEFQNRARASLETAFNSKKGGAIIILNLDDSSCFQAFSGMDKEMLLELFEQIQSNYDEANIFDKRDSDQSELN